jgi:hypothetical protein
MTTSTLVPFFTCQEVAWASEQGSAAPDAFPFQVATSAVSFQRGSGALAHPVTATSALCAPLKGSQSFSVNTL